MSREQTARNAHLNGSNCAMSVYNTFVDVNQNATTAPKPRSDGGKCGAVLAAEQLLREMGVEADFDERFIAAFGALKCAELRRSRQGCNDLVGGAARLVEELTGKQ